jgi:acyl-CoA thioesterase
VFEGASQQLKYHRVFGGQLVGQLIRAASLTCPDKSVKSLHALFARERPSQQTGALPCHAPARGLVICHLDHHRPPVTSHTVWFHRPFRTDRWLLLWQHSPVLAHGRCFGRGDVLTEGGALVASYAQEALLRFCDAGESVDTSPAANRRRGGKVFAYRTNRAIRRIIFSSGKNYR